jgi:ABC-type nitrate/sulfonate/bicarbonate transport system substrate-binding protein
MVMITRRRFMSGLAAAGAAGLITSPQLLAAERALETTTVRLDKIPASCDAPIYAAAELLRGEGFTDVRFISSAPGPARIEALGRGEFDFTMSSAVTQINALAQASRSPSSRACTPAATSCSRARAFAGSPISKASASASHRFRQRC